MNYTELLNRTIKRSGLKNIEIIEKLKEKNIFITKNYLSVLRNDNTKIASEEVSRAIAEVCGAPKSLLVIQGQLDRASNEIKEFIEISLQSVNPKSSFNQLLLSKLPEEKRRDFEDKLKDVCTADMICEVLDNKAYFEKMGEMMKMFMPKERYALIPLAQNGDIKIVDKDGNEINSTKIQ